MVEKKVDIVVGQNRGEGDKGEEEEEQWWDREVAGLEERVMMRIEREVRVVGE